jgi:hypothetical protein
MRGDPRRIRRGPQFIAIRDATRTAIDATRVAPQMRIALTEEPRTSLDRIVGALGDGLSRRTREIDQKIRTTTRSLELHERLKTDLAAEDDADADGDAEYVANLTADREACTRDLATITRMRGTLETDPLSLLLPIGTVVETIKQDVGPYESVPVAGCVGVVVGYSPAREHVNLVSFPSRIRDNYGHTYGFYADEDSPERPPTFGYAAEALKVVGEARFRDGSVNDAPGYRPTHTHGEPGCILSGHDMVVEALGWLWRVQEINGIPERTQMTKVSTARVFDFLKPLETGATPSERNDP